MHWLLAVLLLVGCASTSIGFQGVSVNTSTSNLDEAGGSVSVPKKGYHSQTNVGANKDINIKPPKNVASGGGADGILIVSNSHVLNGTQMNKVNSKVESYMTTRRPAAPAGSWMPFPGQTGQIQMPEITPIVIPPIGFPNSRSSMANHTMSTTSERPI